MPILSLPHDTKFHFMRYRKVAVWGSLVLNILAIAAFLVFGMNYGIDFRGGTTIELRFHQPHDIADIRSQISGLGFGDVQITESTTLTGETDVLIRVEQQPGGDEAQLRVPNELRALYADEADFRRVEVVGPRVSGELARNGVIGIVVALAGIALYIWFRFEWRFGVGAIIATTHDLLMTVGLYAVSQLDFSLTSIAALLTIIGYSLNDTVVVYDRLRENLRRYKRMSLSDLIDLSINEMLSRTIMTSVTTLLALVALFAVGGEVIRSFTIAMIWGVLVGTYSSIFIAAPVLIYLNLRPGRAEGDDAAAPATPPPPAPPATPAGV